MHGSTIEMVGCFAIDLKEHMIITLLESEMMKGNQECILGILKRQHISYKLEWLFSRKGKEKLPFWARGSDATMTYVWF